MATTPYMEKHVPNSRFVIPNTSSSVGLNIRAITNGRKKMTSPASKRMSRIDIFLCPVRIS
jgi:hypothetical protein